MARKKTNWWYVLVLTDEGPKFVTGIEAHHYARYDETQPPLELSKAMAQDIAWGLMLNNILGYAVDSKFQLEFQPYLYDRGHFKWVKKEANDEIQEG